MNNVKVHNPFLQSFYQVSISDWATKKKKLMNLINWNDRECMFDDFYSDYYKNIKTPDSKAPYTKQFINILKGDLNSFVIALEGSPLNRMNMDIRIQILGLWAQRYKNQQWMPPHTHEPYGFSAVLYADFDPKVHGATMFMSSFKNTLDMMDYNFQPEVKEGDIIFFPSSMIHFSKPHNSNKDRTIFSFNVDCQPSGIRK